MASAFALVLATALALLAALHLYWAAGGQWGLDAAVPTEPKTGGQPTFRPGPLATLAVAVLLLAAALVALAAAGRIALPVPHGLVRFGIWALAVVFLVRAVGDFRYAGFFKRVRGTRFAEMDTKLYSPLCLALSALALGVALGSS